MTKHTHHIGGIHSNYKFGLPTPRTYRQATGNNFPQDRPEDRWVFWTVVISALLALVVLA